MILWETDFEFGVDTFQDTTPWSTSVGGSGVGDFLKMHQDSHCSEDPSKESAIETGAAIHGSRGLKQWVGDGHNSVAGELKVEWADAGLATELTELWIRFYFRYPLGFKWNTGVSAENHKLIQMFPIAPICAPGIYEGSIGVQNSAADNPSATSWSTAFAGGGSESDGVARCLEYHMKMDTNGSNGLLDIWYEGTLIQSASNRNWGTHAGWTGMYLNGNHTVLDNANGSLATDIVAVYMDDVAVGDSYIGPLGSNGIIHRGTASLR